MKCNKRFFFCLIFIVWLLSSQQSYAQRDGQELIDSLLGELPKMKEDTNKAGVLGVISHQFYTINPDEGIKYGQQSLELATKLSWQKGIVSGNSNLWTNYGAKADYPKALEYYIKALKNAEETDNKRDAGSVLCNIGTVYYAQSNYPFAMEYFLRALKILEETGN